jgi:hypothetical protein
MISHTASLPGKEGFVLKDLPCGKASSPDQLKRLPVSIRFGSALDQWGNRHHA